MTKSFRPVPGPFIFVQQLALLCFQYTPASALYTTYKTAKNIPACNWQIAKEGLGILHTFNSMKDPHKKKMIIQAFFDRGIWRLIWKNARGFRLRWRLGRRYLKLKKATRVPG